MGWLDMDAPGHEAWLAAEFRDGERSVGVLASGVPDDRVVVEYDADGRAHETRPAAEVIGWRVVCDCVDPFPSSISGPRGPSRWSSALLERVPSEALEDVAAGRIWAPDDEVAYVDSREDVEQVARHRWQREHLRGLVAIAAVREASDALLESQVIAEARLDRAVREARAVGASWETIGRATAMSRQSAHARWSKPPAKYLEQLEGVLLDD